jgi:hypothetical protein
MRRRPAGFDLGPLAARRHRPQWDTHHRGALREIPPSGQGDYCRANRPDLLDALGQNIDPMGRRKVNERENPSNCPNRRLPYVGMIEIDALGFDDMSLKSARRP